MIILKFGGTSVSNVERIRTVAKIIKETRKQHKKMVVVISAFADVTDDLIKMGLEASSRKLSYKKIFGHIEANNLDIIRSLIPIEKQVKVLSNIKFMLNELEDVLHGVYLVKEITPRTLDVIMSFGERLSAFIISYYLNILGIPSEYIDARKLIKTDDTFGNAKVDFIATTRKIKQVFKKPPKLKIITGFIASTNNDETTTLGRGGSDYTASIFGAALNSDEIEIWTDVDGILTADPRKVKNSMSLESISYEEAMELSHFGAKVIYPPTMQPAMSKKIPLRIKNTLNPKFPGTLIAGLPAPNKYLIKGISSIDKISMLNIRGSGMVGISGTARRVFGALSARYINAILITQASSEHSICIAVLPEFSDAAIKAIEEEFRYEIKEGIINTPEAESSLSIIAVVGENMRKTPGISGKVFNSLGRNGVNIAAIAQGASERNISVVIPSQDQAKALNVLHDAFFLSSSKSVNIFLVGTGHVGGTLLEQIDRQEEYLRKEYGIKINAVALANSRKMIFDKSGIKLTGWDKKLMNFGEKTNLTLFINRMIELNLPDSIFIDCTASDEVIKRYLEIFRANISIVTPNKKANASSYKYYESLKQTALKHNVKFAYETNVGAGLPIIGTLKDLVTSGDKIIKIEGILSGTLSFIFNSFSNNKKFSEIVIEAKEKGFTEPDPRDDLRGTDVARKLLILARETGFPLEFKQIKVQNIIPKELRKTKSVDEFLERLKNFDSYFERKRSFAESQKRKICYIAKLTNSKAEVSLQEIDETHQFYSLTANDNILSITTANCGSRPIVIKGPGAGIEVTAAGVFADVIRISNFLN